MIIKVKVISHSWLDVTNISGILLWTFVSLGLYLYRTFPIHLLNGLGYKYQIGIDKYQQIENVPVFGIIAFGLIQE